MAGASEVVVISAPFKIRRRRLSRSSAAKSGSGATRAEGRRSASKGSGIATLLLLVGAPERGTGPHEQRLRGVHAATQVAGDFGHAETVDVPQGQGRAVVRPEGFEHLSRAQGVELLVPRVLDVRLAVVHQPQPALLTFLA